jgi:DNA processing protein
VPRIVRGETATAAPLPPSQGPGAGAAGALAEAILARLGVAPIPEDQLIRDLARPASEVAPEVVALELAGAIRRGAGGMLARG